MRRCTIIERGPRARTLSLASDTREQTQASAESLRISDADRSAAAQPIDPLQIGCNRQCHHFWNIVFGDIPGRPRPVTVVEMASLVQPAGIASSGASAATRNPLMCEKFEDLEIDAAADRVFKAWMDITGICAKLMTDTVTHARCISSDADHHSVGGIVELLYPPGKAAFTGKCTCARDVYRHTHVDYDKRFHTYQFLEGQVMEVCKFYNGTVEVVPTDSGKCVVKHRVEFELIDVNVPHSSAMQEQVGYVLFKRIEQYLKENETAYV